MVDLKHNSYGTFFLFSPFLDKYRLSNGVTGNFLGILGHLTSTSKFVTYPFKLHHKCSTSNLVQPPFNVISIVSMWWKLFMLRKIFQSSNFSLFSKEKGKVVWLTYLIIFNLVCIWILWIYQIFYAVLWLISMSSSIFVFLIISWFS